MWSIYSASFDRVLPKFPPYKTLIEDVIAVVPKGNLSVVDLGAGTGNVTRALLDRGHRVTAIESNLGMLDRKSTRLNSSHLGISYAVFCLKKKKKKKEQQ